MDPVVATAVVGLASTAFLIGKDIYKWRTDDARSERQQLAEIFAETRKNLQSSNAELAKAQAELADARLQLAEERIKSNSKDARIAELVSQVSILTLKVSNLETELEKWKEQATARHEADKQSLKDVIRDELHTGGS